MRQLLIKENCIIIILDLDTYDAKFPGTVQQLDEAEQLTMHQINKELEFTVKYITQLYADKSAKVREDCRKTRDAMLQAQGKVRFKDVLRQSNLSVDSLLMAR